MVYTDRSTLRNERRRNVTKDLTVVFEDRPGTLLAATEALASAGVNLLGGAGAPSAGEATAHFAVADGDEARAREAFAAAGAKVLESREVLVCPVAHRAGGLADTVRPLAMAGVNINLLYLTENGELVLGVDDIARGRSALGMG
jgi:hypothetical protein